MTREPTWAATSVPEIRRRLRNAMADLIDRHSAALDVDPADEALYTPAQRRKRASMAAKLAESIEQMGSEVAALDRAELFWVSRDMVPTVVHAAASLPEWTPELAWPAPAGLLCWARPAGDVPFADAGDVPWDGAWWWVRPDGVLQIQVASRLAKRKELLAPFGVRSPLWSGTTLLVDPTVPRTDEVEGSPEASEFVSILGATWLLMQQRTVAETQVLSDTTSGVGSGSAPGASAAVSIIELRRPEPQSRQPGGGSAGRRYRYRWTVEGHWRQQACGPNWSQRKPTYITGHEKGPKQAPFKDDRVKVFRR